jgi:hypothetical protein
MDPTLRMSPLVLCWSYELVTLTTSSDSRVTPFNAFIFLLYLIALTIPNPFQILSQYFVEMLCTLLP